MEMNKDILEEYCNDMKIKVNYDIKNKDDKTLKDLMKCHGPIP